MSKRPKTLLATTTVGVPVAHSVLVADVRQLILDARQQTAQVVNAGLTLLYWQVGDRVRREILKEKRAEYGVEVLRSLSAKLETDFGHSFGEKNLRRMIQFAEVYPDRSIVVSLIRQLTWTHIIALLPMKDPLQRTITRDPDSSVAPAKEGAQSSDGGVDSRLRGNDDNVHLNPSGVQWRSMALFKVGLP